ncbi:lysophospholipase L1-like esterase [Ewingella americana]
MKTLIIASLISLSFSVSAEIPAAPDNYTTCNNVKCSNYIVSKFNIHPSFFGGDYVYAEPVYASADYPSENLLFKPTSSVLMFNQTTGVLYEAVKDYKYDKGAISFPAGTSVPLAPAGFSKPVKQDKSFNVKVTPEYQAYQIPASYKKNQSLNLAIYGKITDLRSFIMKSNDLKITFFGDSITFGANATDTYSAPNQPPYVGLVSAYMSMLKGGRFAWYNPSVPGWNSSNAANDNTNRMLKLDSSVYVLAFGVNDSNDEKPEIFIENMEKLIKNIKLKNKDARIVLMSPSRPNPEWILPNKEFFEGYSRGLKSLSEKYDNTTFINVTDVWNQILKRKNIWAITGNGVNHPNDYGHRVIAEALLTALLGDEFT